MSTRCGSWDVFLRYIRWSRPPAAYLPVAAQAVAAMGSGSAPGSRFPRNASAHVGAVAEPLPASEKPAVLLRRLLFPLVRKDQLTGVELCSLCIVG